MPKKNSTPHGDSMHIKVLYDKCTRMPGLRTGWGLSFLVNGTLLFDTGDNAGDLRDNMTQLGVRVRSLSCIVISHDHWDHTGGLWSLLEARPGISVFSCPAFSDSFKRKTDALGAVRREPSGVCMIEEGVYSTGQLEGSYKGMSIAEQALVMRGKEGLAVLTGCAHPGITRILSHVRDTFPGERILAVTGGFHLRSAGEAELARIVEFFRDIGVEKAGPTHCTGEKAEKIFRKAYGKDFLPVRVGEDIVIAGA